jgi:hypothetical protein
VAFKAIDSVLRGQNGGFDSHTLPPQLILTRALLSLRQRAVLKRDRGGADGWASSSSASDYFEVNPTETVCAAEV